MSDCDLALEIVHRAVLDWRLLIQAKAWKYEKLPAVANDGRVPHKYCNFKELRRFFKSDWCELILEGAEVTKETILKKLEAELAEAMEKDEQREARKRGQKTM